MDIGCDGVFDPIREIPLVNHVFPLNPDKRYKLHLSRCVRVRTRRVLRVMEYVARRICRGRDARLNSAEYRRRRSP